MSALDSMLASAGEPPLHSSFDYSIVQSSSAVVDRRQGVEARPTGASTLTPTGTRTARIRIGGDSFIDSSSARISFTINNLDTAKNMKFWSGPWGAWGTVRLLASGQEIERIELYGRHHELFGFQLLKFEDQWSEASVCGLHGSWNTPNGLMYQGQPLVGFIEPGERAVVMHKLHLSLFNSHKVLPLRFCNLDLEVTLAPAAHWVDTVTSVSGSLAYSQNYSISDLKVIYDEVVPDSSIVESFYKGLLANQIMSVPCLTAYQFQQSIDSGATSIDVTASRAFSKLSSVWVTFAGNTPVVNSSLVQPGNVPTGSGLSPPIDSGVPGWAPSVRLSIGGKNFPDPAPSDTIPTQYYNLVKALGYSPNITRDDFVNDTYALVFDLKRVPFDHGSGISSRSGDLIRIECKNLVAGRASAVHITMFAYSVVAIRESGVNLLN